MSEMVKYEPWVDDTINVFIDEIRKRFLRPEGVDAPVLDFMKWASYYTMDAASEVVYGERTGFLEQGKDVGNMLASSHQMMRPWLWVANPLLTRHSCAKIATEGADATTGQIDHEEPNLYVVKQTRLDQVGSKSISHYHATTILREARPLERPP